MGLQCLWGGALYAKRLCGRLCDVSAGFLREVVRDLCSRWCRVSAFPVLAFGSGLRV